ncbi:MAG: AAA-like domain-containing protein [Gammaproteobacteria bacterium]
MSKAIHGTEFYVVGGPVRPDRSCYVERAADAALASAIRARHLCCVLGPRGIGKSSLVQRVARRLRESGDLVAVVDLAQIGALTERGSGHGWGMAVAERVAHELELDADVGPWWRANKKDESEHLAEFLWRVVLANTTAPITVCFDGLGATTEPPFVRDLLAALQSCYARRSAEPDFKRLSAVLVGSTSRRVLAGSENSSPWAAADVIELDDFSEAESYTLAAGFEGEPEVALALMDRVTAWTGGHPYLTQKVARAVVRKGGKLEDVERVVRDQLLAPGLAESDPLLSHVRAWLTAKAPGARRAAKLLRRLARGGTVTAPADLAVQERLQLSGVVAIDEHRRLEFRNRIFRELVGQWVKGAGRGWRLATSAVLLLLVAAAAGYWYVQYLPTADIATLERASADLRSVDTAYARLHALPGFAERADRLFATALARQSAAARTVAEIDAIDTRLRGLTGQDETADGLLAAFWLRRATEASHAEQRDAALLLAQRAADVPAAPASAGGTLAELVGDDYPHLERTLHLGAAPVAWRMQFGESTLVALDADKQLQRVPFGDAGDGNATNSAPVHLTALQYVAITRDLAVDGEGTAGAFDLTLDLDHPAAEELLLTLTAPSGVQASVAVPHRDDGAAGTLTFNAAHGTPLEALADQGRRGVWRLTLVDRRAENAGTLVGWALRFADDTSRDDPSEPVAIPDPLRTDAVVVTTEGDQALARPETNGAIGTVALWNIATRKFQRDFPLPVVPKYLAVNAGGGRLIAATDKLVTVWNTSDGTLVARLETDTEFVLPPVGSTDGGYFAIAERVEDGKPLYSVLRTRDGSLVSSFEGVSDVQRWWLGPGARYLALQLADRSIHVLGARRGEVLRMLSPRTDVARVLSPPDGATLLTVGSGGAISAWSLLPAAPPPRSLGTTAAAASVGLAAGGSRLCFATADAAVLVVDVATGAEVVRLRGGGVLPATTQLADDGEKLVTASGAQLRLWNLPAGGTQPRVARAAESTALALDRVTGRLAFGLANGQLALDAVPSTAPAAETLKYFGHRGEVTAVAVNVEHELAVTGGADGIVRTWDLASGMPTAVGSEAAAASIGVVALAPDARWVASASGAQVRVTNAVDGAAVFERAFGGVVTAFAFAPDGATLAIGDTTGMVTIVRLDGAGREVTTQVTGAVTALAFAPGGTALAAADATGALRLLRPADGTAVGAPRNLPQKTLSLDFDADGSVLLLATADWLHALRADATLEPLATRFAPRRLATHVLVAGERMQLRSAEMGADGTVAVTRFDLASPPAAEASPERHDWPAALGITLDDQGQPAPFDP